MDRNAQVVAHIEAGGIVLTPGLRQARIFRRLHDRAQIEAGRRVWPSARIYPLDVWLQECWREAGAHREDLPVPLPGLALDWLWRRQVTREATGLVDPAAQGTMARQSWLALRAHGGTIDAITRFPLTRDQQAFVAWARGVETALGAQNACDPLDLARLLAERGATPSPGPPLLWAGFRRLTPGQSVLCDALRAKGWSVSRVAAHDGRNVARRHAAPEPDAERRTMIDWLRERLEHRPDGLHAVIVADLAAKRGAFERALVAALQPALELPAAGEPARVFDLAGGDALASQLVVEAALDALACSVDALDWPRVSRLLRSRYLADHEAEREARVRLDVMLRSLPGVATPSVAQLLARSAGAETPRFAARLKSACARVAAREPAGAGTWAERFGACLAAWGWPGDHGLSSREFQAANRLREILRELAAAAAFAPELGREQAFDELRRLAALPFQAESGEPAVFVLDALEDPGVRFDSLWVAGLTAAAWPRPMAVDALLPIEIQRRLAMPRATAEACVSDAREIVAGWRAASKELVLSWPFWDNDTECDGTSLLPADVSDLAPPTPSDARERLTLAAARLEPVPEAGPPPIRGIAHGGARVVELQSHCPFRAFALLRLRSEPLEEPKGGVDRRQRGIVLHRTLEDLWREWRSQQALLALVPEARVARVAQAVDRALAAALPAGCGERTLALERDWQCRAVAHLLDLDAERPPFTVVETERAITGRIGGLELALRVDRVDRVGDVLVVIDYKSGNVRKAQWRGARMEAPQLPLYAVLHPARPAAIAIAEASAGRAAYRGVARDEGIIESLETAEGFALDEQGEKGFSWDRIREHWYAWLERLAADHARGRADVDPKLGPETCRSCHLGALCRVAAVTVECDASEDAGDDE